MTQFHRLTTYSPNYVAFALQQLDDHPELWDQHPQRTRHPESPHRETSDIWLRYRDPAELHEPSDFRGPHWPVFYPAWRELTGLHSFVYDLARRVRAVHVGGILLTRMKPGTRVYSHDDRGAWHAEFHNAKVWMPLVANGLCFNQCCDEQVVMKPGEAWMFDNLLPHSVINAGDTERITLICSYRTER